MESPFGFDCGTEAPESNAAVPNPRGAREEERVKVVHVAENPFQANLVAGLLRSHGIPAFVGNEATFGVLGEVPLSEGTLPQVVVADSDFARARQVLGEDRPGGACRR